MTEPNHITVVPATLAHAKLMAPDLRIEDRLEIEAVNETPERVLAYSVAQSMEAWTAFWYDRPIAMWGIGIETALGNVATPWLLTTPLVEGCRVRFARQAKEFIDDKARVWKVLYGYTDSRYARALKLLRWLGFEIDMDDRTHWPLVRFERRA